MGVIQYLNSAGIHSICSSLIKKVTVSSYYDYGDTKYKIEASTPGALTNDTLTLMEGIEKLTTAEDYLSAVSDCMAGKSGTVKMYRPITLDCATLMNPYGEKEVVPPDFLDFARAPVPTPAAIPE